MIAALLIQRGNGAASLSQAATVSSSATSAPSIKTMSPMRWAYRHLFGGPLNQPSSEIWYRLKSGETGPLSPSSPPHHPTPDEKADKPSETISASRLANPATEYQCRKVHRTIDHPSAVSALSSAVDEVDDRAAHMDHAIAIVSSISYRGRLRTFPRDPLPQHNRQDPSPGMKPESI